MTETTETRLGLGQREPERPSSAKPLGWLGYACAERSPISDLSGAVGRIRAPPVSSSAALSFAATIMRRFAGLAITAGLAAAVPERRQEGHARWCVGEPLEEDEVSSSCSFLAGNSLARWGGS